MVCPSGVHFVQKYAFSLNQVMISQNGSWTTEEHSGTIKRQVRCQYIQRKTEDIQENKEIHFVSSDIECRTSELTRLYIYQSKLTNAQYVCE